MKREAALLLLALLLVSLTGCARNTPPSAPFEGRPHGMYPGTVDGTYEEYRLGLGDEIELAVQGHPEFGGKAKVESNGLITVPTSLDRIQAAGLTLNELEKKIAQTIRPYLSFEPRLHVTLSEPNSRFVYVLGAVRAPGKYPIKDERLYVREAVVRAGLPLQTAALKRVTLTSSTPERYDTRQINLKSILRGNLQENYELKPGDVIEVPQMYISDVSWWLSQILRPFQIIVGYDTTSAELAQVPTASTGSAAAVR